MIKKLFLIISILISTAACDSGNGTETIQPPGDNGTNNGTNNGTDGNNNSSSTDGGVYDSDVASPCNGSLPAVMRDFNQNHPDFFPATTVDCKTTTIGLVQDTLDSEHKPVFKSATGSLLDPSASCDVFNMLSDANNFSQWYRTTSGINTEYKQDLPLVESEEKPGYFIYENTQFFPLDGVATDAGISDDGNALHNYLFTTEIHTMFQYQKGQEFYFYGDDDVWIFVNNQLALDLGGVHIQQDGTIYMDNFGLTEGQKYRLDIFQAERQPTWSNFKINTSISCFTTIID